MFVTDQWKDKETDIVTYRVSIVAKNTSFNKWRALDWMNSCWLNYFIYLISVLSLYSHTFYVLVLRSLTESRKLRKFFTFTCALFILTLTQSFHMAALSSRVFQSKIFTNFEPALSFIIVVWAAGSQGKTQRRARFNCFEYFVR